MPTAISVQKLTKNYGRVRALHDVSLDIPTGQITGLVGPNGAGKSTLIKSLVGALRPTAGTITVLGLTPIKQRWQLRKRLGYMPQEPALYIDLSARENVTFYAKLHRSRHSSEHTEALLQELDLGDRLDSPVHTLSGGMQKRVSLACALVHNPELLVLDEPTAALDPLLKRHLWKKFRELTSHGKTLLISTHLMDEAMLCDRVVLLQRGRVVAYDTPQKLIATGRAVLRYRESEKEWAETVPSTGEAIADALHQHGLSQNITSLELAAENLEDVMIDRLKNKGEK